MNTAPIALIAVSEAGAALARKLESRLPRAASFVYAPYAGMGQTAFDSVPEITARLWSSCGGFVFLCASGIAVRAIAPLVASKHRDPGVVVTADNGAYAVSLLGGHEGGANRLAEEVAAAINAIPVISTASEASPRPLPRNLVAGIGCRRGTGAGALRRALEEVFAARRISLLRLRSIASIDVKHDEPGLLELAETLGVPIVFLSADELNAVPGEFTASGFVKEITGTENVCERAAVLGARGAGRIVVPKTTAPGITVAVYEKASERTPPDAEALGNG